MTPAGTTRLERVIVVHPDFPDLTFAAPSAPEKEQGACRSSMRAGSELGADQACPDRMSKLSSKEDIADMVPEGREKNGVSRLEVSVLLRYDSDNTAIHLHLISLFSLSSTFVRSTNNLCLGEV